MLIFGNNSVFRSVFLNLIHFFTEVFSLSLIELIVRHQFLNIQIILKKILQFWANVKRAVEFIKFAILTS